MTARSADRRRLADGARSVGAVIAIVIGALAVVAGEFDDSPGLQGLGCLLILAVIVLFIRRRRRRT